ncbi:MAG TPA: PAS domain-containing sensor histidine kinase [Anaerolineae bacterium]|nr:PAS domain-containing sensor histidine kinase [Anaerolineae bacterium]
MEKELENLPGYSEPLEEKHPVEFTESNHGLEMTEELRQSEELFRLLVESVVDYAIFLLDPHGYIVSWNAGAKRIKGYQAEEIIGQHFSRFYPDEDVQQGKPDRELEVAKAEGRLEDEGWRIRQDGSRFWANVIITALTDQEGKLRGFAKVTRDFTERKQVEEQIRQSQRERAELQRRLIEGREAERLQLAQELHDGPIQELYGIIYILSDLAQAVTSEADQAHFAHAQKLLQGVVRGLRTMAAESRPPTLAPFGLEKAIKSHIDRLQQAHRELKVKLELMPDGQMLPEQTRLALFRIYQAALNNVLRHATAHQVIIRFRLDEEQVVLEVQDDGQGFELPERWIEIARQGHLGLIGMVERAESIGGQLNVVSAPGQGTVIQAIVPHLRIAD